MCHRLFLALIVTASLQPLVAQTIQVNKENKTIAITATDSAETEADTADITIGFTAYGTDEQKTYADSSVTSNRIIAALTSAGIPRDHIHSISQNLSRIDTEDKLRYTQGIRFTFSQGWKVTTKAANASDVLHLAVLAGANNSGGIDWRLADDNALEAEAARKALEHAQQIAERMAGGLHAKLGSLVYASNQVPQRNFFGGRLNTESASLSSVRSVNLKPLAIIPDKVNRTATVYAVFALE
jgi:uncharacterized protein YggE